MKAKFIRAVSIGREVIRLLSRLSRLINRLSVEITIDWLTAPSQVR